MNSPNVLLIVMDSVRAANTSLHGHEHETTSFLEEFAEQATVYEQARSPGTWSLPSHTSMFTGMHVAEHGVTRARHELEPGHTIFEMLADDHGYDTGVFSENTWITDMPVGLKEAFDTVEGARNLLFPGAVDPSNFVLSEGQGHYVEYLKHCLERDDTLKSLANGVFTKLAWDYPQLLPDRFQSSTPARVYGDLFLDWQAERDGPWAACVNFMDGHLPYLPDDDHDEWGGKKLRELQNEMDDQVWEFNGGQRPWWQRKALEGLYDGTIRQMDAELERVLGALEERGELEDTLVVVTSDHGEGFGEPSRIRGDRDSPKPNARVAAHGAGIHEVLTHVPLVVQFPGQSEADTVTEAASLTQFPSVVEGVVEGTDGLDAFVPDGPVVVSSHGLEEPMEERAQRYTGDFYRFNGDARAVYDGAGHCVEKALSWREKRATVRVNNAESSYKSSDADEARVDEVFDEFTDLGVRSDSDGMGDVDDATRQRLEDLGYA
ncbi:arylsulfatase [Halorubrum sp. Ib24]|uniref:sulfatase n=1 Tax=Halorubrum sp. Ib24 TaxID=1383850 RepID=UPI000B97DCEC|nr:sulfatase [Halorubrum sp. Ib24]OYR38950.1 arylsulfatase [Halorubrum sp. Ib24]